MKTWMGVSASALAGLVVLGGTALAQTKAEDCKPQKIEGQIVNIDYREGQPQGKIVVRGADGQNYEFNATKDTLADKKVGDKLEVTKRLPANCK